MEEFSEDDDPEKSCHAGCDSVSLKICSTRSFSPSQEWKLDPSDSREEVDLLALEFNASGRGPRLKGEEAYPFCLEALRAVLVDEAESIPPKAGEPGERGAF